jgi:hypothetical protein
LSPPFTKPTSLPPSLPPSSSRSVLAHEAPHPRQRSVRRPYHRLPYHGTSPPSLHAFTLSYPSPSLPPSLSQEPSLAARSPCLDQIGTPVMPTVVFGGLGSNTQVRPFLHPSIPHSLPYQFSHILPFPSLPPSLPRSRALIPVVGMCLLPARSFSLSSLII